jgi:hypothetical protein
MIEKALGIVNTELNNIDVPYEFMRWTSTDDTDIYWVGEFAESPTDKEDGYEEGTLILTGTTKNLWSVLMEHRAKIKDHFPSIGGLRIATDAGTVVIFYENSTPIPTGDANLKRIQVNLRIKMWKGMN